MVPVPMQFWRQAFRGTNSAWALADVIGRGLSIPVAPQMLKKKRKTPPQLGLTRSARLRNVRGGIGFRAGYYLVAAHVMVVDDVLTTGATCSEVARVLKNNGARQVTAVAAARTL